jgi:hypothetical protein
MQAVISIPQPCSQNWEAMQPDANGRHCNSCAQTVVDFTTWELQDIAAYLKKNGGQHTCGRFLNNQLNQPFDVTTLASKVISWRTDGWRKVAALIIVCFALASCNMGKATNSKQDKEQVLQVMGDFSISGSDTLQKVEKKAVSATAKLKAGKHSNQPIGYAEPYEGHTMGLPELEEPHYEPLKDSAVKHQPLIGPPEDSIVEIK